ncbi:MAG: hypothetical protein R3B72_35975 [Polyangiaceae bacterium]
MFDPSFFTDNQRPQDRVAAMNHGRVRPDLREQAIVEWQELAVEPGYVWRSVGPTGGVIAENGRPMAGLTCDIEIETSRETHMYLATRSSGIWHSADTGASWSPLGDALPTLQTVTVAIAERSGQPTVLLAAAGELVEEQRRNAGLLGAFRSFDAGRSWAVVDGGVGATIFRGHDANRVVHLGESHLVVATRVGLFFSADAGRNFGANADHDDGKPMLRGNVTDVVVEGAGIYAVVAEEVDAAVDPRPPDLGWQTTTSEADHGIHTAVYVSIPGTMTSFQRIYDPDVAVSAAPPAGTSRLVHRAGAWMLSVAHMGLPIDTNQDFQQNAGRHHSIQLNSVNPQNAADWDALPTGDVLPIVALYAHALALESPTHSRQRVRGYFGTVGLFSFRARERSAGWDWSGTPDGQKDDVHADQHALVVLERSSGAPRIWLGNDGGVFHTDDRGGTWHANNGHATMLVWTLAFARKSATEARLSVGFQDNGTAVGEGPFDPTSPGQGWSWVRVDGGDGGATAFLSRTSSSHPQDDPQAVLTCANGNLHQNTQTAGVFGVAHRTDAPGWGTTNGDDPFPFSESVVVARGTSGDWDRIYFSRSTSRSGPGFLFRQDAGGTPVALYGTAKTSMITALAAAPGDASAVPPAAWDDLWFGTQAGELFSSRDAGANITSVPVPRATARLPITGIAVDPRDSERVVVVYGGFSESGRREPSRKVFLSEDRGRTWRDISGTAHAGNHVPDLPVLGVVITRSDPAAIVVTTDLGVLVTIDDGTTWRRLGPGIPKVPCSAISVLNDEAVPLRVLASDGLPPVAVGTFGRGAFILNRPTGGELVVELDGGFGAMKVGEERRRRIRVHNVGDGPVSVGALGTTGFFRHVAGPDDPTVASFSIPAQSSRAWWVACHPTAAGMTATSLTIGSEVVAVSVEAFDDGKPRLAISRRTVRFGPVPRTTTETETVTLENRGQADLVIQSIQPLVGGDHVLTLTGVGFDAVPAAPPAKTLAPGESVEVQIHCAADDPPGTGYHRQFLVDSNDPVDGQGHHLIDVYANAAPAPLLTPTPEDDAVDIPDWGWGLIGLGIGAVVGAGVALIVLAAEDEL